MQNEDKAKKRIIQELRVADEMRKASKQLLAWVQHVKVL